MRLGAGFLEVLPEMAGFTPALNKGVMRATDQAEKKAKVPISPELGKLAREMSVGVAAAAKKAKAKVEPTADTGRFKRKLADDAGDAGRKGGGRFKKSFTAGIGKIALGSAIGGGLLLAAQGLSGAFGDAFAEAKEAAKVGKVTDAIIKSTGGAAKVTAGQIGDYAQALSNKIGVDDEAIQAGQNLMLTFKGVANQGAGLNAIFDRATAAGADLAAAGFGSIEGNAKMLGKALNDPTKGLTALTRAGVTFTADQQKQIKAMQKSGDLLGAQKIILKEVESQVGGTAAASVDAADKAKVGWGNFLENLGTMAMPAVNGLLGFFTDTLLPGIQGVLTEVGAVAVAAFKVFQTDVMPILQGFWTMLQDNVFPILSTVFQFLKDNPETVKAFAVALGIMVGVLGLVAAAQWAWNLAMTANPIGIIVVAIAALVAGIVWAWNNVETFRTVVTTVFEAVKGVVLGAINIVHGILTGLVNFFTVTIPNALKVFIDANVRVFNQVKGAISGFVDGAKQILNRIVQFFVITIPQAVMRFHFNVRKTLGDFVNTVRAFWDDRVKPILDRLRAFFTETIPNSIRSFRDKVGDIFNSVRDKISYVWNERIRPILDTFRKFPSRIVEGFSAMRDRVGDVLNGIRAKAAIPVNFVIREVYNNGIRKMINLIPGVDDLPEAPEIRFASGGVLPGYSPGRDIHKFTSPTGGRLALSGGEAIMRPEFTRAFGGAAGIDALNAAARKGNKELISVLLGGDQHHAGGGLVNFKGGTFTEQFAGVLQAVAKQKDFNLFQGGFRPTTSYSGTSHAKDAIDVGPVSAALVRLLRDFGVAAWDRTGMGNWSPHIHGVPLPGVGTAGGSGVWQAQDYLNGGNGLSGADNGAGSGYRPGINQQGGGFTFVGDFFDAISKLPGMLGDLKNQFDNLTNDGFGKIVKDAVTSSMGDVISWINDKIPGPGPLPGFATGGVAVKGGWARVGENGPENVFLPKNSVVEPNGGRRGRPQLMVQKVELDMTRSEAYIHYLIGEDIAQEQQYDGELARMGGK